MASVGDQRYLDPKTLERIKRLDLRARLVVEGFLTGGHQSPYHGFAVEFAGHREYAPGDETKHIDWKVWSKTDRLYIKQYEEETNLKCTLLVDCSRSMHYGVDADGLSKYDYAATAAASLAYLLQQQQDAVGLVTFNTEITNNLAPSAHPSHLKRILHELEQTTPDQQTDVSGVFGQLASQIRQRGLVILFSDLFVDPEALTSALNQFRLRQHEVLVFQVLHDDELTFPFDENTRFRGLEMDRQLIAEPRTLRQSYLEVMRGFLDDAARRCAAAGIDHVLLGTADPLDAVLSRYLTLRRRVRRKIARR